ncbi:COG3617 Prophage antirepressor [uncultured Caudovirales phage]|uniref:COG3617 Prophage antirepressor n=1 Tax=uncultured Caudovirales phage TaxID=2100421 RepID=A0A6J7WDE7_9CAUD|nr:COG3617 Prophage antirepressor [uncultured Caudovirales phage]
MTGKSEITQFTFPVTSQTIRVVIGEDGEPRWVANDLCECLGIANSRDALSRLDDDEKDYVGITDAMGRPRETAVVNESGLYSLFFTSRKPEAKAFKKWVTSDVLPSIRKTGGYGRQEQPAPELMDRKQMRNQLMISLQREEELEAEVVGVKAIAANVTAKLAEAAPKVEAMKRLEGQDGSMCVTDAAKTLKMRPKELFDHLSQIKWAYKRPGNMSWIGYQDKLQSGLLEHVTTEVSKPDGSTSVRTQMKITAKGIAKLAEGLGGPDGGTPLFA